MIKIFFGLLVFYNLYKLVATAANTQEKREQSINRTIAQLDMLQRTRPNVNFTLFFRVMCGGGSLVNIALVGATISIFQVFLPLLIIPASAITLEVFDYLVFMRFADARDYMESNLDWPKGYIVCKRLIWFIWAAMVLLLLL